MGLHLHTKQLHGEVEISVSGSLSGTGLAQLQAAIDHFKARDCSVIHLNVEADLPETVPALVSRYTAPAPEALEFAIR
jgi:hypothetical protein